MPVIQTDLWLDENFDDPEKLINPLLETFGEDDAYKLYGFLQSFGMYRPNRRSKYIYEELKENGAWGKVEKLLKMYQQKWRGPDIPIYIFPAAPGGLFSDSKKSGLSFTDKVFLFLPVLEDDKELEALFVHEYHHVCRINKQQKNINLYTLLDSIVLEGLAEFAVETCCGKQYRSNWCTQYSRAELETYWNKYLKENLDLKKNRRAHDQILFGDGRYPRMLGYSAGYEIISIFREKEKLSVKKSFTIDAKKFLPSFEKN
ncbi:DUF2268 domain-containing protein [Cytobacillus horneckiae]|uniref:DUF2268 domain-containing protein n=1 Tax=Cytobacillus horneckiae TaxID=549687 RepID=UPI003D9A334B